ncbi:plasmid Orf3 domain-containing protein [Favolaschia claudopus]|uniref:Plasmid Orf3 domain-containing protein n=1 Tax=Favolaschia claudopus TaxID=2862362 RepID=A0AAW0D3Y7_9AGAR
MTTTKHEDIIVTEDSIREVKSISKKAFCKQCQVTKHISELKRCGRCQLVKYCSPACQRSHWKVHKAHCKTPEEARQETEDESWKHISDEFGHKRPSVLQPVSEKLEEQAERFRIWEEKWEKTIMTWAFWAMNIPSPSTRDDKLSKFTFVFEAQRRNNPPTPDQYFEMHGAEIMHTSQMVFFLDHMKRPDIIERWRRMPRRNDAVQIMIMWKGHVLFLQYPVHNFAALRSKAPDDPVLGGYDALAKDWVVELRKAIDSGDPEYYRGFYNRTWGAAAVEASMMGGLAGMRRAMDEIMAREGPFASEFD